MAQPKRVFVIKVAKDHKDYKAKCKKGITLAMLNEKYPSKDNIKELLQATLDQELMKQHIPFNGKTTDKKANKRKFLKLEYVDYLNSVNLTHYTVKELTKKK